MDGIETEAMELDHVRVVRKLIPVNALAIHGK